MCVLPSRMIENRSCPSSVGQPFKSLKSALLSPLRLFFSRLNILLLFLHPCRTVGPSSALIPGGAKTCLQERATKSRNQKRVGLGVGFRVPYVGSGILGTLVPSLQIFLLSHPNSDCRCWREKDLELAWRFNNDIPKVQNNSA